jgi:diguanylate cyclase (GGDEF)-like protein
LIVHAQARIKYLWVTVLVFGLLTAIGWTWQRGRIYADEIERATREAQVANEASAEHARRVISQGDTYLRSVRSYYLRTRSLEETRRFVNSLNLSGVNFGNIYLIDARGNIILASEDGAASVTAADRQFFQFHRQTAADIIHIAAVELGRLSNKYFFRITRRIDNPNGSFGGIVLLTVDPQAFTEYFRQMTADVNSSAALLGTLDRKLRARLPEPAPQAWQTPVQSVVWDALSRAPTGAYRGPSGVDGVERHFVYRAVRDLPLVMVTGFSPADVTRRAAVRLLPFTIGMLATLAFICLLAAVLTVIYRQRQEMETLAITDALTNIANRRHAIAVGGREVARARRYAKPLSVLMLDIDHFKVVNDTWGHRTGDRVLQSIARTMQTMVRDQDTVGRLGGEEFSVILPETALPGAQAIAERMRVAVQESSAAVSDKGEPISVTVSIGVADLLPDETDFDTLLVRADKALY